MFDSKENQDHRLLILVNELMKRWITQVSLEKVRVGMTLHYCQWISQCDWGYYCRCMYI